MGSFVTFTLTGDNTHELIDKLYYMANLIENNKDYLVHLGNNKKQKDFLKLLAEKSNNKNNI